VPRRVHSLALLHRGPLQHHPARPGVAWEPPARALAPGAAGGPTPSAARQLRPMHQGPDPNPTRTNLKPGCPSLRQLGSTSRAGSAARPASPAAFC
jgi:hypothetical protein